MKSKQVWRWIAFGALFMTACILSVIPIRYSSDARMNAMLRTLIPLLFSLPIAVAFLYGERKGLFARPVQIVWMVVALAVALNNLPWLSWLNGDCTFALVAKGTGAVFLLYCLAVGLFEEIVFRGLLFPCLIEAFSKTKKGLVMAFVISSVLFGVAHLGNLFVGAGIGDTLLQTVYSTLIGGLCAFVLLKTKNIVCPSLIHILYNFCGLLFDGKVGLGTGIPFYLPTLILTVVVGLLAGIIVIIALFSYTDQERKELYERMGISA